MDNVLYQCYKHLRIGFEIHPDAKRAEEFLNHTAYGMFSDADEFYIRFELQENGADELDLRDEFGDTIVDEVKHAICAT